MLLLKYKIRIFIRYYIKKILNVFLRIFYIFPIKRNRIVFDSFGGKQISCNPFYIYKYLYDRYEFLDMIWVVNNENGALDDTFKNIRKIRKNSILYFYGVLTCKFFITNDLVPYYIPFRKKQLIINTWHGGGAYKKVGTGLSDLSSIQRKIVEKIANKTDFFLSSSKKFTEVMSSSMHIKRNKFLEIGMPRNDMFFCQDVVCRHYVNVRKIFNISADSYVILYAPTFRRDTLNPLFNFDLDIDNLIEVIRKKTSVTNVVVLFRGHHTLNNENFLCDNHKIVNVSNYPFMQELLCCADMLISDYSSCIWDYSLLYRPCLLFVPDLKSYQNERSFYVPIKEWGFPLAQTNDELFNIISNFDKESFCNAMRKHHANFQSYEHGNATYNVAQLILDDISSTNHIIN